MPLILIESFEEFAARHGGDFVKTRGLFLFPSGATCDEEFSWSHSPPVDPTELLRSRREYVQEKLTRAVGNFRSLKNEVLEQGRLSATFANLPGPPDDAPQELQRLKAIVEKWREELQGIEVELEQTPEAISRRERQAEQEAKDRHLDQLMSQVVDIEI